VSNEPAVKKDKGEGGGGGGGRGGGGGGGGGIREYLLLIFLFIFAVFAGLSKKEREEMIKIAKLGRKIRRGEVSAEDEFISVFENILAGGEEEGKGKGEGEGEEKKVEKKVEEREEKEGKEEEGEVEEEKEGKEEEGEVEEEKEGKERAEEAPPAAPRAQPPTKPAPPSKPKPAPPTTTTATTTPAPAPAPAPAGAPPAGAAPTLSVPPETYLKIRNALKEHHYDRVKKYVSDLGYTYVGVERHGKKLGVVICREGKIFVNLPLKKTRLSN